LDDEVERRGLRPIEEIERERGRQDSEEEETE
jgi:hypothetical protein